MYTKLDMLVIRTVCPETKNEENCPVQQYLENNQKVFHLSMGKENLIPRTNNTLKIACGLAKIRKICKQCGKTR